MTRLPQAQPKVLGNKQAPSKMLWINSLLVIATTSMVVVSTLMTNAQVAVGAQANALFNQRQELANQVSQLRWQAAQNKSLQHIQEQATSQLGMVPVSQNLLYLQSPYDLDNHEQNQE